MNSFFASCEQYDDPSLRDRPVGVCPVLAGGGAVIAASYEAKRHGVGMGCRAAEAARICPGIVLLQARPARYVELHRAVMESIEKHVPITKAWSIDEWAVRLRGDERRADGPGGAVALARRVKGQIAADFDGALPCSVGLAPSRLLAKTACELEKPDGLTVLTLDRMPGILARMPLGSVPGIGSGMEARLRRADVDTVAKLWALSRADCRRIWGSVQGESFWMGLHGTDPAEPTTVRRSMGHAHILPPQYRTVDGAHAIMTRLLCKAAMRLRVHGYVAHLLQAQVSFERSGPGGRVVERWGDEIALPGVEDTPTVLEHFARLWPFGAAAAGGRLPRKVGVGLGGLTPRGASPGNLFPDADRPRHLSTVLDTINQKYGAHTVHPGSMTAVAGYVMDDKIAFGRIPEEGIGM